MLGLDKMVNIFNLLKLPFGRMQWHFVRNKSPVWLELGSGPKRGVNGWTTVDGSFGADVVWDLRRGIPLPDGSVKKIYSSHLLEHISFPEMLNFLKECIRVLERGGEFSVCVPNAGNYIEAYLAKKNFRDVETFWQPAVVNTNSWIDQINYIAYMGGQHHYLFDRENLVNTLKTAGFTNVKLREYEPGLDREDRNFESIYAVAFTRQS